MISRRGFIQLFSAAIAGISAAPPAAAVVRSMRRRTTKELLIAGVPLDGVGIALVDAAIPYPDIMDRGYSFRTTWYRDDLGPAYITCQGILSNVTLSEAGILDADDISFQDVYGDESGLLMWLNFRDGSKPILFFQTSDEFQPACAIRYPGVPLTPNGGNVHVQWPNEENRIVNFGGLLA